MQKIESWLKAHHRRRASLGLTLSLLLLSLICGGAPSVLAQRGKNIRRRAAQPTRSGNTARRAGVGRSSTQGEGRYFASDGGSQGASGESEKYESPEERLRWFLFQRTFPFKTLPSQGRANAFAAQRFLRRAGETKDQLLEEPQAVPHWEPIGPIPIMAKFPSMGATSGRINAIAISPADPKLILVGGATGGIWRSVDGGESFTPVSDNQVDLAVGALAFSRSNPEIVYAGMGDVAGGYMGTGVLRSNDGGRTWRRVSSSSLPAPGTIANIVVDPTDPDRLYVTQYSFRAATGQGEVYASGFFLSTDGGTSWVKTMTGLPRDLVLHPMDPKTLYLTMSTTFSKTKPSGGLYISRDGGQSWQPGFAPGAFLDAQNIQVATTPAAPDTIFVYAGGIVNKKLIVSLDVSTDGGKSWSSRNISQVDSGQFGYNSYIFADPRDAKTIYIGNRDVYKSVDGGISWTNLTKNWFNAGGQFNFSPTHAGSHTDQHVFAFSPSDPQVIYIGNDGGLSRSSDGGNTFTSLNQTLSLTMLNSISMHPTNAVLSYSGTQDNGAVLRSGGSQLWREFIEGDSGGCLLDPLDPSIVYSTYIFGSINRFRNNGETYDRPIASSATFGEFGEHPRIGFYPAFAVNPASGELYFGTWKFFVSKDRGDSWNESAKGRDLTMGVTQFGADVLTAIGVGPGQSKVIYTGSSQGRVMVTLNGGEDWQDRTAGLPPRFIKAIVVDRVSANTAYVTVSGFGSGHVFKTQDGGTTWNDISGNLPNIPVNALLIDPLDANVLYVGTDIGVFRSTANGIDWEVLDSGLPPVVVTGFSSQANGTIQIATYGRGAYLLRR